jgi:hypothetical protein
VLKVVYQTRSRPKKGRKVLGEEGMYVQAKWSAVK